MTKKNTTHEDVMAAAREIGPAAREAFNRWMNAPLLTAAQLQEIRDRCEKATPGPWVTDAEESIKVRAPHGGYVSMIGWLKGKHGEKGRIAADEGADNAHFIAVARTDIPSLLNHIAAQDAEIVCLNKVADWLAQAVANDGYGGVRRSAKFWREEAERMVNENGE